MQRHVGGDPTGAAPRGLQGQARACRAGVIVEAETKDSGTGPVMTYLAGASGEAKPRMPVKG